MLTHQNGHVRLSQFVLSADFNVAMSHSYRCRGSAAIELGSCWDKQTQHDKLTSGQSQWDPCMVHGPPMRRTLAAAVLGSAQKDSRLVCYIAVVNLLLPKEPARR